MNAITIKNISLTRGQKCIYKNFSLSFEEKKITTLIAPSGAGKTTLLDLITNKLKAEKGTIESFAQKISYVFQEDRLLPWLSVEKNIALPLDNLCRDEKEKKERVTRYLNLCGLADKKNAKPTELSGGEKQRVSIARAFAYPSDLLLMDEAFQSLDLVIKFQLLELFSTLVKEENRTVIWVTHDIREALCLADRIIVLQGSPLSIVLDTQNIQVHNQNQSCKERYIHLSSKKIALQEDILSLLS